MKAEDVTDEIIDQICDTVGHYCGAWDMVDAREIVATSVNVVSSSTPTVTVPREEWERMKADADEWDSLDTVLKAGLAADLSEIGFNEFVVNALISKMTKIQERFATPSNAVESQTTQ